MRAIRVEDVIEAIHLAETISERYLYQVEPQPLRMPMTIKTVKQGHLEEIHLR
jgi:hypothetical protein